MWKVLKKYNKIPVTVKAATWFLICSVLQNGISVITTPIFTRLMSTEEYGTYNVFNSWMNIITVIITLNMARGVYTQGLIKFSNESEILSSSLQGLTIVFICIFTIIYLIFRNYFNALFSLNLLQMILMLILIWTSSVYSFWAAEQRVKLNYKLLVGITLFATILKPITGIILINNMTNSTTARILGIVIVEIMCFLWMFFYQEFKGKAFYSKYYWKYAIKFCIPLVPHYLSQTVLSSSDRIMIEKMIGKSEAGIYGLAYSISQLMSVFSTALLHTVEPWIFRNIKKCSVKSITSFSYLSFILIGLVNLGLIAIAPEALKLFAPSSYHDAIWIIPPVAISVFFQYMYSIFSDFEFYYEKTFYIAGATMLSAIINITLNYFFIKKFGYIAAGYTTLLCYLVYAVFHFIIAKKIIDKEMHAKENYSSVHVLLISFIFVTLGLLFILLYSMPYIRYIIIFLGCVTSVFYRNKIILLLKYIIQIRKEK